MFGIFKTREDETGQALPLQVARGTFWVGFLNILKRLLSLARILILARLLAPDDFGLYGIAAVTLSALDSFSRTGITQALIQKKGEVTSYLNTAWTIQIIRGVIIAGILVLVSSSVAAFFDEPRATSIIQVIALAAVFRAFQNVGIVLLDKELNFKKIFSFELSGTLADLVVSITAAVIFQNVWAIIFGLLAKEFVLLIASFLVANTKLKLSIQKDKFSSLYKYGKYLFLQGILLYLFLEGDDILVGKMLGTEMLGFYQMAYIISNLSATEISHVISRVFLPAFSKIQEDLEQVGRILIKSTTLTSMLSFPIAGGFMVLAPEIIGEILGTRWLPLVTAAQILCVFGAVRSLGASIGPVYHALNRLDVPIKINLYQLFILILIIYPLTLNWGINGTSISITISLIIAFVILGVNTIKLLDIDFRYVMPLLGKNFIAVLGMCLFLIMLKTILTTGLLNLAILIVSGAFVYFLLIWILQKKFLRLVLEIYRHR